VRALKALGHRGSSPTPEHAAAGEVKDYYDPKAIDGVLAPGTFEVRFEKGLR
jgi:hypothetical protein